MFVKRVLTISLALGLSLAGCGTPPEEARIAAVHDGLRVLGLAEMSTGSYEFRLCDLADSYTPEVLRDRCINPLVTSDGLPVTFSSVPGKPDILSTRVGNWAITVFAAVLAGGISYAVARSVVKNKAIHSLGRESYVTGSEAALERSKQFEQFELDDNLAKLLDENGTRIKQKIREPLVEGKESKLENKAEVNRLFIELEDELMSGPRFEKNLNTGVNKWGRELPDEILDLIVKEKEGKLALKDSVRRNIRHNRTVEFTREKEMSTKSYLKELEEGLAHLKPENRAGKFEAITNDNGGKITLKDNVIKAIEEGKVSDVDPKELSNLHNSISAKIQETVVHLNKEVSKKTKETVEKAVKSGDLSGMLIAEVQRRIEKLEALTQGYKKVVKLITNDKDSIIKNMGDNKYDEIDGILEEMKTEEMTNIVTDGNKGREDVRKLLYGDGGAEESTGVKNKLENVIQGLRQNENALNKNEEQLSEAKTRIQGWLQDLREQGKKGRTHLKKARKELKNRLNDDGYKKKMEDFDVKVREIVNNSSTARDQSEINKIRKKILAVVKTKAPAVESEVKTVIENIDGDIDDIARKIEDAVKNTQSIGDEMKEKVLTEIRNIDGIKKKNILARLVDRVRKFSPHNTFKYIHGDGFKVTVRNRSKVVERIGNEEDVGIVTIEKGLEKLISHVAMIVVPFTSLPRKLPGQAKISARNKWEDLTGGYSLTTSARVDDMRHIIEGLADATGSKVSDEVFYFLLRSGVVEK